jgi:RNA polymerase sigma factor (sigma-70 family)
MSEPVGRAASEVGELPASVVRDRSATILDAFETYHAELYSFLRRLTRDDAAAEDLLQETYLRLTTEASSGRSPDHVRSWLYRVASNLAISRGRRRATVVEWLRRHGGDAARMSAASPETHVVDQERRSALDRALRTIPVDARTALLMSTQGFSGEEIAAAIGRSHLATRALMARARVRLRGQLEQEAER